MPEAVIVRENEYSLADSAILSQPWLSASTLLDELARPTVVTAVDPASPPISRIVVRKRGTDLSIAIQASGPIAPSFLKTVEAVGDLLTLPAGWNSYAAKEIAPQSAVRAIRLLADVIGPATPAPAVVPRVQGGIQLEWHTESIDVEVYIDSTGNASFFAENLESGYSDEGSLAGREQLLREWVQRVSGR